MTGLGEVWKIALSLGAVDTELALCQCCSRRIAEKDGDNGKVAAAAAENSSQRGQMGGGSSTKVEAAKREDRSKMKKEAKLLRCALPNGSAWSTERKYMRRYRGKCDIFFGSEHRLRKEDIAEQFNKEQRTARMKQQAVSQKKEEEKELVEEMQRKDCTERSVYVQVDRPKR